MANRNRLREEVSEAIGERLSWAARHDRRGLGIMALQIVHAVWFTTLWTKGFPTGATAVWAAVFALSIAGAIASERRR